MAAKTKIMLARFQSGTTKIKRNEKRQILFRLLDDGVSNDVDDLLLVPRGCDVIRLPYGWSISGDSGEWEIVVLSVGRQDQRVAWSVQLIEVDGEVCGRAGLVMVGQEASAIMAAIHDLTVKGRWKETNQLNQHMRGQTTGVAREIVVRAARHRRSAVSS